MRICCSCSSLFSSRRRSLWKSATNTWSSLTIDRWRGRLTSSNIDCTWPSRSTSLTYTQSLTKWTSHLHCRPIHLSELYFITDFKDLYTSTCDWSTCPRTVPLKWDQLDQHRIEIISPEHMSMQRGRCRFRPQLGGRKDSAEAKEDESSKGKKVNVCRTRVIALLT